MSITTPLLKDDNYILWTKEGLITWDDFQGEPDPKFAKELKNYGAKVTATIDHRIQWAFDNEDEHPKLECRGVKVWCFFNKELSWVKQQFFLESQPYIDEVLSHEQGHFDLAEEYTRFIETKLKEMLLNEQFRIPGQTKEEKLANIDSEIAKLDKRFYQSL